MAWINWLLKPKCMLIHILFWNFLCCVKIWCYNIYIYILERLGRMHENKTFFFETWQKPGILISDLYLYSIKIQTDIDQNAVTKLRKITDFWKVFFFGILNFFFTRPDPAQKETGSKSARNKTGLLSIGLDSVQPQGLGWGSSPTQQ